MEKPERDITNHFETWQKHKELAVYGAMVAMLVSRRDGPVTREDLNDIQEEAWAIARLDAAGEGR